jgi:hypothetical protein
MYSFLANRSENKKRKVKKKPQKAGAGRELNFEKEDDAVKKELIQARIKEWNNWVKYTDVKAISKDELEKLKKDNPTLKVIPTRWVDVNKSEIDEEPRYKSRLVVRGDLENATSMRTDSPTASTTMLNCVFALSACKRTSLRAGDISAAFLQGSTLDRILVLSKPKGGIPRDDGTINYEEEYYIVSSTVYGTKDAPRGWFKVLDGTEGRRFQTSAI